MRSRGRKKERKYQIHETATHNACAEFRLMFADLDVYQTYIRRVEQQVDVKDMKAIKVYFSEDYKAFVNMISVAIDLLRSILDDDLIAMRLELATDLFAEMEDDWDEEIEEKVSKHNDQKRETYVKFIIDLRHKLDLASCKLFELC